MIVDMILYRREKGTYEPVAFALLCNDYEKQFPNMNYGIANSMKVDNEQKIKEALCNYIIVEGYPLEICDYINKVKWINERASKIISTCMCDYVSPYDTYANGNKGV
jgi:hypothetical protein